MADALTEPIQRPRHIPSLDGLRALSVALVIVLHTLQRRDMTTPITLFDRVMANGALGVFIFFVISGYLITTLLLREREKTGTIRLGSFYIRRAFRILPPLYVYIFVVEALGLTGHMPGMNTREFIDALTFTRNYDIHISLWAFEHLWSLCIEEQFYLLWPGILVWCLWRAKDVAAGKRAAAWVAVAVILVEPATRLLCFVYLPLFHNPGSFHMQADSLMFGAVGALLQGTGRFEALYRRATRWPWLVPVLLFFVSGTLGIRYGNYWYMTIGTTVNGLLSLTWMMWLIRNPVSLQGRVFNQAGVAWFGRLSYSLYVWQTLFLHHESVTIMGRNGWWNTFPTSWVCIFVCAVVSYYVVEQPALRLRDVFLRMIGWRET